MPKDGDKSEVGGESVVSMANGCVDCLLRRSSRITWLSWVSCALQPSYELLAIAAGLALAVTRGGLSAYHVIYNLAFFGVGGS